MSSKRRKHYCVQDPSKIEGAMKPMCKSTAEGPKFMEDGRPLCFSETCMLVRVLVVGTHAQVISTPNG